MFCQLAIDRLRRKQHSTPINIVEESRAMNRRIAVVLCFCISASSLFAAEFERISENLFVCRDTCNVYVVKSGGDALLIDFGSGKVLKHLSSAGIEKVDWALHTNFFRRKCQGDRHLAGLGVQLAVPAKQRAFFEDARGSWDKIKLHHSYSFKPGPFIPTRSVPVDKAIEAGEDFEWKGIVFSTLENAGPTEIPGLTYLAEIDGVRVAFTGDLIHSPGKIWDYSEQFTKYGTLVHEVKDLQYGQYVIQPNDKGLENYQRFLLKIHNEAQAGISNDLLIVHDELHQYLTKQSVLKELYQVVLSDRNKGIQSIFISTEPQIIPNWILNNTAHVFSYRQGNKSSIEWMRDYIGLEAWLLLPQDLRYELKEEPELVDYSFVYRDKRKSKAQVCIKK